MEISVRCYYVSVSYDKFIKQGFHPLRIIREEDLHEKKTIRHPE